MATSSTPTVDQWKQRFVRIAGEALADKYAKAFFDNGITPATELTESRLAELGVKIGHREEIEVAYQIPFADGSELQLTASMLQNSIADVSGCGGSMKASTVELKDGTWINIEGSATSLSLFQDWVRGQLLVASGRQFFPASFGAAFAYTKPMPYFSMGSTDEANSYLLVLRTPKAKDIELNRVAVRKLTDLFIVLVRVEKIGGLATIVTVHRRSTDDMPWMASLIKEVAAEPSDARTTTWRELVGRVAYEVVCTSKPCLDTVRLRVDALCGTRVGFAPGQVIEEFQVRGRQAQTLNRVLSATARVLGRAKDLKKVQLESFIEPVFEEANTLHDLAEELENLAFQSMETRITLLDFRAQENTKLFTYIAMITQPLGLMTGWYGMNFSVMPELPDPNGYYYFIAAAASLVVILITFAVYRSIDWSTGAAVDDDADDEAAIENSAEAKQEPAPQAITSAPASSAEPTK